MLTLIKLENRIVLDGAAPGEALEHFADHDDPVAEHQTIPTEYAVPQGTIADAATLLSDADDKIVAPTSSDGTVSLNEDGEYVFKVSDFAFSDADGDGFQSIKITRLETAGKLQLDGLDIEYDNNDIINVDDIEKGNLVFIPNIDAEGIPYSTFQFQVSDDGNEFSEASFTMSIGVNATQDKPTAVDSTVYLKEDEDYTFKILDFGFTDMDKGDELANIQIISLPTAGELLADESPVKIGDEISAEDITNGTLIFKPELNANSSNYANFEFKVSDGEEPSKEVYTMTIDVEAVNDPPRGEDKDLEIKEDEPYTFKSTDFGFNNIVDSGDELVKIMITQKPSAGRLLLNGVTIENIENIEISVADINQGKFIFEPSPDTYGDSYTEISFKVNDGENYSDKANKITVKVTPQQDAPMAIESSINILEDTEYTFSLSDFGYYDVDDVEDDELNIGKDINAIIITRVPEDGSFKLDGENITNNQEISIADIEANKLTFMPVENAVGNTDFEFMVSDGVSYSDESKLMTISIGPVDDLAKFSNTVSIYEDVSYQFKENDFDFQDVDQDTLVSIIIIQTPTNGDLLRDVPVIDGVPVIDDGVPVKIGDEISVEKLTNLIYIPNMDAHSTGNDANDPFFKFRFKYSDGENNKLDMSAYEMKLKITSVNDSPDSANNEIKIEEDQTYIYKVDDFTFSDARDGDAATNKINAFVKIINVSTIENGHLELDGIQLVGNTVVSYQDIEAERLIFKPDVDQHGKMIFQFKVNDGHTIDGDSNLYDMTMDVQSQNDAPEITTNDMHLNPIYEDPTHDSYVDGTPPNVDVKIDDIDKFNNGTSVRDILADGFHDDNFQNNDEPHIGIAVTSVNSPYGEWQYKLDGTNTWENFESVSEENAILLDGNALIRFIPNENWYNVVKESTSDEAWNGDTVSFEFRAWDGTDEKDSGDRANVYRSDIPENIDTDTSAYGRDIEEARIDVIAVNDAPQIINNLPVSPDKLNVEYNTPFVFSGTNAITIADIDANIDSDGDGPDRVGNMKVTLTVEGHLLQIVNITDGAVIEGNNSNNIIIVGTQAQINTALDGMQLSTTTINASNAELIVTVDDLGHTGLGGKVELRSFLIAINQSTYNHYTEPGPPTDGPVGPGPIETENVNIGGNLGRDDYLPGHVGDYTVGGRPQARSAEVDDAQLRIFCSLEQALKIGCRFAAAQEWPAAEDLPIDLPQARLSSFPWEGFRWERPVLTEEDDLFTNLFMRENQDPGLGVELDALAAGLGSPVPPDPSLFTNTSDEESFNDAGPGELKESFFKDREDLDESGRWEPQTI